MTTLKQFMDRFGTDEASRAHLESVLWPDGPVCPHCGVIDDAVPVSGARALIGKHGRLRLAELLS